MATQNPVRPNVQRPITVARQAPVARPTLVTTVFPAPSTPTFKSPLIQPAPVYPPVIRPNSPTMFRSHRQGKPVARAKKQTILNVYSKLREKNHTKSVCEIVAMTSELTGVSNTVIFSMRKEFRSGVKLTTRGKTRPNSQGLRSRMRLYDERTLAAVRREALALRDRNEVPIARKVCAVVNADRSLPGFSVRTMQRLLVDMGMVSKKVTPRQPKQSSTSTNHNHHQPIDNCQEPDDIVLHRRRYLRDIYQHRQQGRTIYYVDVMHLDEPSPNTVAAPGTTSPDTSRAAADLLVPGQSNERQSGRIIVLHAGNEDGFVPGAEHVYRACNRTAECPEELDGPGFEHWLAAKLLPNIKPRSVIVLSHAPFHTVRLEQVPNRATPKTDVQTWLTSKGVAWLPDMIKVELLALVAGVRHLYEQYRVDSLVALHGHSVLRLPPYHGELNPMELVWERVKGLVLEGGSGAGTGVEELVQRGIGQVTNEQWAGDVSRVLAEEEALWEIDAEAETDVVDQLDSSCSESSDDALSS